jgi:hypothetical protein
MRFLCTIYSHDEQCGGVPGGPGLQPRVEAPLATVTVSGRSLREAAARAYVRGVGRTRARILRDHLKAPRAVFAQETNVKAIAAGLRRTSSGLGDCYQLDNLLEAWYIKVEPLPANSMPRLPRLRRLRLSPPVLRRLLRHASPN